MDKLKQKYDQLGRALKSLEKALVDFEQLEAKYAPFKEEFDFEAIYKTNRDSVVQRFEYTIDLFWKYIKKYLEQAHVGGDIKFPSEIMREAYSTGLFSEEDAETILLMIKSRNNTSHLYIEEVAEQLVGAIPSYYKTLSGLIEKIKPK